MKNFCKTWIFSFLVLICLLSPYSNSGQIQVQNVILMIGDGMGWSQITAARVRKTKDHGRLKLEEMPITGVLFTHSHNNLITDSAAAATALATGFKTHNGKISIGPNGKILKTIMEEAREKGKGTGLVVTSTITHATPACFSAHVQSRREEAEIARQFIDARVNILLGGGKKFFLPSSHHNSAREDDLNLLERAEEIGYEIIDTKKGLQKAKGPYVLGLFNNGPLSTHPPEPALAEMTKNALRILSSHAKGFLLMIEGSQIDWGSHANDTEKTIRQMLLFDEAVGEALQFARKNKKTLVLVTADHATGGMTISGGSLEKKKLEILWATESHTGEVVPLFAFGPGAEKFSGMHDNTEVAVILRSLLW